MCTLIDLSTISLEQGVFYEAYAVSTVFFVVQDTCERRTEMLLTIGYHDDVRYGCSGWGICILTAASVCHIIVSPEVSLEKYE